MAEDKSFEAQIEEIDKTFDILFQEFLKERKEEETYKSNLYDNFTLEIVCRHKAGELIPKYPAAKSYILTKMKETYSQKLPEMFIEPTDLDIKIKKRLMEEGS